MSDIDYFIKDGKRKNKKRNNNEQVPAELYTIFPHIHKDIIQKQYKLANCNQEKTIDSLLAFQIDDDQHIKPNKVDQYFDQFLEPAEEDLLFNFEYFGGEQVKQYSTQEFNTKYSAIRSAIQSMISSTDEEFIEMMDDCKKGIDQWLSNYEQQILLGVDTEQVPQHFIQSIQSYLWDTILIGSQEIKDDLNEFPLLPETQANPFINQIKNKNNLVEQHLGFTVNDQFQQTAVAKPKSQQNLEEQNQNNLIRQLCEEFPKLSYSQLKYAFNELQSYEKCKQFLYYYYPTEFQEKKSAKQQQYQIGKQMEQQNIPSHPIRVRYDNNKLHNKFQDLRQQIQDMLSNRTIIQACAGKHAKVINQQRFNTYISQQKSKLIELQDQSIYLFAQIIKMEKCYEKIDLHGFFGEEVDQLLDQVLPLIKIETRSFGKRQLEIVVGKGLHSKNKKSVLGPKVEQYLTQHGYQILQYNDGRIIVKI